MTARRRSRRLPAVTAALLAATALVAGVATAPAAPHVPTTPRCFGAASRDRVVPCFNPALRTLVRPTPIDAVLATNAHCTGLPPIGEVKPCRFGTTRKKDVRDDVALMGDSHSGHWRAALDGVAAARGWRGTTITRCPFSTAPLRLDPVADARCARWQHSVVAYFRAHPEIHTVFVSNRSRVPVATPPGRDPFAARVQGYVDAWRSLPRSVRHIVVLRDVPVRKLATLDCIEHQMATHGRGRVACAVPRAQALRPDPQAVAVARLHERRVLLADLTPYFCSPRLCFPVVGGALVDKDENHMTETFAQTLTPYLLRRVDALLPPPAGQLDSGPQRLALTGLPQVHGVGEGAVDLLPADPLGAPPRHHVHLDGRTEVDGRHVDRLGHRPVGDHLGLVERQLGSLGVDDGPQRQQGEDVAAADRRVAVVELVVAARPGQGQDPRAVRVHPAEQAGQVGRLGVAVGHEVPDRGLLERDDHRGQPPPQLPRLGHPAVEEVELRPQALLQPDAARRAPGHAAAHVEQLALGRARGLPGGVAGGLAVGGQDHAVAAAQGEDDGHGRRNTERTAYAGASR